MAVPEILDVPPPALLLEQVRFVYPGASTPTLDIAALRVAAGERVMLRGPSGCGKSTLLSLVAGVLVPQSGTVMLQGRDWQNLSATGRDAHRVDHVGYVFQQFNLLPYLSTLDNALLPCGFSKRRHQRATAKWGSPLAAAKALLDALELPASLYRRPAAALSVGQQQRVAAARALIGQPEILIADEPTSALDEDRREAFMRLLLMQCAQASSALLFVTHDARLAPHFDRVVDLPAINRIPAEAATD